MSSSTALQSAIDPDDVAKAIRKAKGQVTIAAEILSCARRTVYRHINKHEHVEEALRESRQRFEEVARMRLYEAVQNGEPWAIRLVVTKGLGATDERRIDKESGEQSTRRRLQETMTGQSLGGDELPEAEVVDGEGDEGGGGAGG